MKAYSCWEDAAWAHSAPNSAAVLEGWAPAAIARWYKMIGFQLLGLLEQAEAAHTPEYLHQLKKFYNETWKENPIDENVNVEVLENLLKKVDELAEIDWPQSSWFKGLSASLTELRAWQATQGTQPSSPDQNADMVGGGAGGSMPPLNPDFGPEEEKPPGTEGEENQPPGEEPLPGEPVTGAPPPGTRPERPQRQPTPPPV